MSKPPQQPFSTSKRHFHWSQKVGSNDDESQPENETETPSLKPSASKIIRDDKASLTSQNPSVQPPGKKLLPARLRSVLSTFGRNRASNPSGLGTRVVGTLFGSRKGHVIHFAFQKEPNLPPAFLIELATPIGGLVKEMASGLVRIALECDKRRRVGSSGNVRLLEEPGWRAYCNGKKCGFGSRKECGVKEAKLLKAVEMISMGAGVMPASDNGGDEVMYMRAKFERIVGSRDSEAFYMMNPDRHGAPELSIYLLRV
ncbi:Protein MIZU-KUSSEI 1 [Linum grandiflorum]